MRNETPVVTQDVNPSDVSHNFRLMGATFLRKLNQSVDRNADKWGVENLSVTMGVDNYGETSL